MKTFNNGDAVECTLANQLQHSGQGKVYLGRRYIVLECDNEHGFMAVVGVDGRFSYDRFKHITEARA